MYQWHLADSEQTDTFVFMHCLHAVGWKHINVHKRGFIRLDTPTKSVRPQNLRSFGYCRTITGSSEFDESIPCCPGCDMGRLFVRRTEDVFSCDYCGLTYSESDS